MFFAVEPIVTYLRRGVAIYFVTLCFACTAYAQDQRTVDELLKLSAEYLKKDPEKTVLLFDELEGRRSTFDRHQNEKFFLLQASSYGLRGRNQDRIKVIRSYIDQVTDPDIRALFLYQLSVAYIIQGEYENALKNMNESMELLPKLSSTNAKISTLQSAIALLVSLRAYEEAYAYAQRMNEIDSKDDGLSAKCYGLANIVEIKFLKGDRRVARTLVPEGERICEKNGRPFIAQIIKMYGIVDLIDSGNYHQGIAAGLQLLKELKKSETASNYVIQLEDALARAYMLSGKFPQAELYGTQAFQHAKAGNDVLYMEKSNQTMAVIKRAQGQFASSLEYYDAALALKDRALNEQLHKNIAYQRVKFDTQDKANQVILLEQKNKVLAVEKQLEKRNSQNLWLVIALVTSLLLASAVWLLKTLQQKNLFRLSAQIDGLTQISNRSHFMANAKQVFRKHAKGMSVVVFDMDSFKQINDTFGHAVGDWVLKTISDTVKAHLRKADIFGRLGGEEFAICLPESDEAEAQMLAERCRAAIAAIDTQPSGYCFPLSASFGVAARGSHGLTHFEETLAAADKALYFSKSEGRNRVSLFQ